MPGPHCGVAAAQVLHHQQEIQPQPVDHRAVDQRMLHLQGHTGREQPRLVEQVAVAQVHDAMPRGMRLEEHGGRPAAGGVGQAEARAAVGAVVARDQLNLGDARIRMAGRESRRHPLGRDLVPLAGDAQGAH